MCINYCFVYVCFLLDPSAFISIRIPHENIDPVFVPASLQLSNVPQKAYFALLVLTARGVGLIG